MTKQNEPAGNILEEAKRVVCDERTAVHGETQTSFWHIAQLWQAYLRATHAVQHTSNEVNITAEDVAQMMSLLKKVRHIFGDRQNPENFIDDAGYVSIAGMFADIHVARVEPAPTKTMKARLVALNAVTEAITEATDAPIR